MREDEVFIKHLFWIDDHPIGDLPPKKQIAYFEGLRYFLLYMYRGSNKLYNSEELLRIMLDQLCFSVLGYNLPEVPQLEGKERLVINKVRNALSVKRVGLRFFRMKYEFFSDVNFFEEVMDRMGVKMKNDMYRWLQRHIVTSSTSKAFEFFFNGNGTIPYDKKFQLRPLCRRKNQEKRGLSHKKVLVVANMSSGKSTLINALCGYRINKTSNTVCTKNICEIFNKPINGGIAYKDTRGTLFFNGSIASAEDRNDIVSAAFHFKPGLSSSVCLVDTPGINNIEFPQHRVITENAVKNTEYDLLLYVSNCQYLGTNDEEDSMRFILQHSRSPVIFVLNQLDRFKSKEDSIGTSISKLKSDINKFTNPRIRQIKEFTIIPVSAYSALMLSKEQDDSLDEDEIEETEEIKEKFDKKYYDLPAYVSKPASNTLDRTGITLLKETINKSLRL